MDIKTQKPHKTVGILEGMGPAASADFYEQIVDIAQRDYRATDDTDFPPMFIYNLPLEGFDETGFVNPEAVKEQLIAGVKKLEAAGSDFVTIPCNPVHHFEKEMQKAMTIPLLSIIEVTTNAVVERGFKKVGVLNSQSTRQYKLYDNSLTKRGVGVIGATEGEQKEINHVVHHVMGGTQGPDDIDTLRAIITRFVSEGAEAVVLGCTELPLAISQHDIDIPLLNSTALLAQAALRKAYGISQS